MVMESTDRQFIKIVNWEKYQHYKDRNPPWIKLYFKLLDKYEYRRLQDASKLLLIHLWMLRSKLDKDIPFYIEDLQEDLKIKQQLTEAEFQPLIEQGFIEVYQDDSVTLADCKQDAIPETETETKTERERETKTKGKIEEKNGPKSNPEPSTPTPNTKNGEEKSSESLSLLLSGGKPLTEQSAWLLLNTVLEQIFKEMGHGHFSKSEHTTLKDHVFTPNWELTGPEGFQKRMEELGNLAREGRGADNPKAWFVAEQKRRFLQDEPEDALAGL